MKRLTAMVAALAMFAATPAIGLASARVVTGGVRGVVVETSGRPLSAGLRVQLVNSRGAAVPGKSAAVAADGSYTFSDVEPGIYTVQVVGAPGSTAVSVSAGRVATANVSVSTAAVPRRLSTTAKWLITLAAIGGGTVVAVIATRKDASGSQ